MPAHAPGVDVSVDVRRAAPAIAGALVLNGGPAWTMLEARLVAVTLASAFVAVTRTRRLVPTSATPSRYVVPVAPAMSVNPEPESCCHWCAKARPGPVH